VSHWKNFLKQEVWIETHGGKCLWQEWMVTHGKKCLLQEVWI
jgi:hypothetical protein